MSDSVSADADTPATVLIVDDQADNLILMTRYLRAKGYSTRTAGNGIEALAAIELERPDLVLLDVIMPEMDGFKACEAIKSNPETMFLPVVLVTALDSRKDKLKGLEAGADEFLSKPVNKEELLIRVRSLIRWQEARNEAEQRKVAALRATFGRYVSPRLVESILSRQGTKSEAMSDRESRVGAAVMFADLRNFTQTSERLAPDAVVSLLNEYFTALTNVTHQFEGTIFNMAGDSLLVGFGVPFAQPDSADRAAACAIAMQAAFTAITADWPERYGTVGGMGIGINYGDVVVGNVGSAAYMSYTVIGDTVNVAARLCGHAPAGTILVSEKMRMQLTRIEESLEFRRQQPLRIKGKSELQIAYTVASIAAPEQP